MITEIIKSINDNFNIKINGCTGNCQTCTSIFCTKAPNTNSLLDSQGRPKGYEYYRHFKDEEVKSLKRTKSK